MPQKQTLAATAATLGGLLAVGGATYAFADGSSTTSPSPSASASSSAQQRSTDTVVTGTVADAVKAAVQAKDSSVTISTVQQDADGSYDALGTKSDGTKVQYDVSKDYKTVTLTTGRTGRDRGTAVTGTTLTNVKNAITAKYSGVTVTDVRQDTDGSYHAVGTKGTTHLFFTVSKDLKTVTEQTAPAGGHGGARGTEVTGATLTAVKNAVTAKYSGVTVTDVRQDTDGSYHVAATKGTTRVFYTVSKDLKTITVQAAAAGGPRGQQPSASSSSAAPSASASASASATPGA